MVSSTNALGLNRAEAKYIQSVIEENGVAIITMNRPEKLNGWTLPMMQAFKTALIKADEQDAVKAIIFTGRGRYYSAGVNLGGTLKLRPPRALHKMLVSHNKALFEAFLRCKKPILAAVNGPAIGASVTSATLCNGIIAAESATFSTPFAALGITPEGCSSVHFERLMGKENAKRMLGLAGWRPTAQEALAAGLVQWVVPDEQLMTQARQIAGQWIEQGQERAFLAGGKLEEFLDVNARESEQLADAFLGADFMNAQARFLWRKNKRVPSLVFFSLWASRPLWGKLL